ncbi:hypothetical protein [Micromonospora zhanjiangensis]|uniref:DUF3558 domain-containing protein n=1 Tax=Micromonospora zhanjiangensis TaxID=1522057 RepID=A0ABV8KH48_9ACTN
MRGQLCLIGAGLLLVSLSGCDKDAAASTPIADPAPAVVEIPARAAGGACRLLDFAVVEQHTGTRFDVAAASESAGSQSCVLRTEDEPQPALMLAVTRTAVDASIYRTSVVPKGATTVSGLGKAAYRTVPKPAAGRGVGVEIGWLAAGGRMVCLRFTFPAGRDEAADGFAPKLLALAKQVDAQPA